VTLSVYRVSGRTWEVLIETESDMEISDVALVDEQTSEPLPDVGSIDTVPGRDLDQAYFEHDGALVPMVAAEFTLGGLRWRRSSSGATTRL
jgi:hypothetical protein